PCRLNPSTLGSGVLGREIGKQPTIGRHAAPLVVDSPMKPRTQVNSVIGGVPANQPHPVGWSTTQYRRDGRSRGKLNVNSRIQAVTPTPGTHERSLATASKPARSSPGCPTRRHSTQDAPARTRVPGALAGQLFIAVTVV